MNVFQKAEIQEIADRKAIETAIGEIEYAVLHLLCHQEHRREKMRAALTNLVRIAREDPETRDDVE